MTENNVYEMLMDLKDILNAVQNIAEQYYQENKKLEQEVHELEEKNIFLQRELENKDEEYSQEIDQLQEEYDNRLKEKESKYERLEQEYYKDKEQMREIGMQWALLADTKKQLIEQNEKLIAKDRELKDREDTYKSNFAEYKRAREQLNGERDDFEQQKRTQKEKINNLNTTVAQREEEIQNLNEQIKQKDGRMAVLDKEVAELNKNIDELNFKINNLQQEKQNLKEEV